jgi:hypothetical protein
MIIVGYQGIGKSSCRGNGYIDLESSNFFVDGKRDDNWHKVYINIAEHLSSQGYVVFISSHKCIREELNKRHTDFLTIFPALDLKDAWIERLRERYDLTKTDKNFKAYMNAIVSYEDNIKDLMQEEHCFELKNMSYNLSQIITEFAYGKREEN